MKSRRDVLNGLIIYFGTNMAFIVILIIVLLLLLANGIKTPSDDLALVAVILAMITTMPTLRFKQPYDDDIREVKTLLREIADHLAAIRPKEQTPHEQ